MFCEHSKKNSTYTTSAVAKLIPKPPALVDNMNKNFLLPGELYSVI